MNNKATVFFKAGKDNYAFPFPYLSKQFVKVRYDKKQGADELEYNRDYTIEGQTVMLRQKGEEQSTICIYRQTPTGSLVDFNDGSILLASEMDKMAMQMLHIEEENSDYLLINGMLTDKTTNAWQGQGRRIAHLEDPIDAQDAVTLHHLETVGGMASLKQLQDIKDETAALKDETNAIKGITDDYRQDALRTKQAVLSISEEVKAAQSMADTAKNEIKENVRSFYRTFDNMQQVKQEAAQEAALAATKAQEASVSADDAKRSAAEAQQLRDMAQIGAQQANNCAEELRRGISDVQQKAETLSHAITTVSTTSLAVSMNAGRANNSAKKAEEERLKADASAQSARQYAAEAQSHAHFNGVIETHNIKDGAVTEEKMDTVLCKKLLKGFAMANSLAQGIPDNWGSIIARPMIEGNTLYEEDIFLRDFFYRYTSVYVLYEAPLTPNGPPIAHIKPYTGTLLHRALGNVEQFNLTGDSNAPYVVKGRKNNKSYAANHLQFIPNSSTNRCGIVDILGFEFYHY